MGGRCSGLSAHELLEIVGSGPGIGPPRSSSHSKIVPEDNLRVGPEQVAPTNDSANGLRSLMSCTLLHEYLGPRYVVEGFQYSLVVMGAYSEISAAGKRPPATCGRRATAAVWPTGGSQQPPHFCQTQGARPQTSDVTAHALDS